MRPELGALVQNEPKRTAKGFAQKFGLAAHKAATRRSQRRRCRLLIFAIGPIAVGAIGVAAFADPTPHIVWNGSESVARGLYRIVPCPCNTGDLTLVRPPLWAAQLASGRGYLPADTPILKRIAAAAPDEICRRDAFLSINGMPAAIARSTDQHGRPMPVWRGCHELSAGEVFLLNDHPASFDGRYLGAMKRSQINGRAVPIWTYATSELNQPK
ncbi:MAG: S26 family signal peptidase [Pseudomonadota bacterium]